MARDSVEEDALLATALKLSATDYIVISEHENPLGLELQPSSRRTNRCTDAEVEEAPAPEGQVEARSPVSILKNRKHTEPPPCLDLLELEGETGRKALIMEVQAVLRSSHGSEPSAEEVGEIQQKYSIDAQDVMSIFTYFGELMCTFSKNIREQWPAHVVLLPLPLPLLLLLLVVFAPSASSQARVWWCCVQRRPSHRGGPSCVALLRRGAMNRTLPVLPRALESPLRMLAPHHKAGTKGTGRKTVRSPMAREHTSGRMVL
jgi:hypothetical protein